MDERIFFIQQQTFAAKLIRKLIIKSIKRWRKYSWPTSKTIWRNFEKKNMAKESMDVGQWINQHIDLILDYRGKWIALSVKKGIISADEDYDKMKSGIKKIEKNYFIWFVNENLGKGQSLMVRGVS